jgi:hypothetical protein
MHIIAYGDSGYTSHLAESFCRGVKRHGDACYVFHSGPTVHCDAVWMYGLHATETLFYEYEGIATRIVGDLGYWRERAYELELQKRPIRISINAQQPDKHLQLHAHPSDRFDKLHLDVEPVQTRGEYILITGHDPIQANRHGYRYGAWEAQAVREVRAVSLRPIMLREKPNCERIVIDGTLRSTETQIAPALRNAFAVVCLTGNVGADAILHGVPVFAESGPGAVYSSMPLNRIDDAVPLSAEQRIQALSDIAYWQWTEEEFESGELFAHLKREVLH